MSGFTAVSLGAVRDGRLSWEARGLLLYALSLAHDVPLTAGVLEEASPGGGDVVRAALAELERCGYCRRINGEIFARDNADGPWPW